MGELCHCGRTAARTQQPDPWEGRLDGYCDDCATNRCDCYPNECPVKHPVTVPARRPVDDHGEGTTLDNPVLYQREALPVDDALDGLAELVDSLYDRKPIENEYRDALSTVRSEVERLREERDEWENTARAESDGLMAHYNARQAAEGEVRQLREDKMKLHDWGSYWKGEARRLTEGLREQGEPIMDERFRDRLLRHVLSNEEVSQLVDAIESREARARALLSANPPQGDAAAFCEHGYTTEDSAHPSAGLERCPTCSPSDGGGAK